MIDKIFSGGQTGVDRAALDVAIQMGITHGGWVPRGRIAEDGIVPEKYRMRETSTDRYEDRTERNVIDTEGTLLLSNGNLEGGTLLTKEFAVRHGKPWLHVELDTAGAGGFEAGRRISDWVAENGIRILNVAGPRASQAPGIYDKATRVLRSALYLCMVRENMPDPGRYRPDLPRTPTEAVSRLISEMTLRQRTVVARMREEDLHTLVPSLGEYIRQKFGLDGENRALRDSALLVAAREDATREPDIPVTIIRALWDELRRTHGLRLVK